MRRLLLVVVLGCAGPTPRFVAQVGPFALWAQEPEVVELVNVQADVDACRGAFEGGLSSDGRWRLAPGGFDAAMAGTRLVVHPFTTFPSEGRTWVGTWGPEGIDLGCRGDALPHEVMHALDFASGDLLTSQHPNWDWAFDDATLAMMSHSWLRVCAPPGDGTDGGPL